MREGKGPGRKINGLFHWDSDDSLILHEVARAAGLEGRGYGKKVDSLYVRDMESTCAYCVPLMDWKGGVQYLWVRGVDYIARLPGKEDPRRWYAQFPGMAMAFVVGGLIILWVEARHRRLYGAADMQGARRARVETVDDMTPMDALKVGLFQCVALIPGTSRSGATIIGSILLGFSRKAATEFSFFLGIPTLMGAGAYTLLKNRDLLRVEDIPMFAVGTVVSFFSALVCIRWLIRYVSTHDFVPFAWYRIIFGGVVLLTAYTGWVTWAA